MSHGEKSNPAVVTQPGVGYVQPGYAPPQQGVQYNAQGQVVQGYPPNGAPGIGYVGPAAGVPGGPPQQAAFMDRPHAIPGVPPGLEYLSQIDQLLVHQQVEIFELLTSWETQNKYVIKNSLGQQVYYASEESGTCMRQCCGPQRGFIMHITDNLGQEVIRVVREFKCCAGWSCCANCNCCAMVITIEAPVGQVIGSVRQTCSFITPKYDVLDADGHKVFGIEGPCCVCQGICCTADVEFNVSTESGTVGKVSKQWTGLFKEMITQADNFGVTFPMDLDVRMKAVLVGAVFLIGDGNPQCPLCKRKRQTT